LLATGGRLSPVVTGAGDRRAEPAVESGHAKERPAPQRVCRERRRHPVTVRAANGDQYPGAAARLANGAIYIECRRLPPLGSEVTVKPDGLRARLEAAEWHAAGGTVIWRCPHEDRFGFAKGFGIRLHPVLSPAPAPDRPREGRADKTDGEGRRTVMLGVTKRVRRRLGRVGRTWPGQWVLRLREQPPGPRPNTAMPGATCAFLPEIRAWRTAARGGRGIANKPEPDGVGRRTSLDAGEA
jgi:hypothetical protein